MTQSLHFRTFCLLERFLKKKTSMAKARRSIHNFMIIVETAYEITELPLACIRNKTACKYFSLITMGYSTYKTLKVSLMQAQ